MNVSPHWIFFKICIRRFLVDMPYIFGLIWSFFLKHEEFLFITHYYCLLLICLNIFYVSICTCHTTYTFSFFLFNVKYHYGYHLYLYYSLKHFHTGVGLYNTVASDVFQVGESLWPGKSGKDSAKLPAHQEAQAWVLSVFVVYFYRIYYALFIEIIVCVLKLLADNKEFTRIKMRAHSGALPQHYKIFSSVHIGKLVPSKLGICSEYRN